MGKPNTQEVRYVQAFVLALVVVSVLFSRYYWGVFFAILSILIRNKSIYAVLRHPSELRAMIALYNRRTPQIPTGINANQRYCYDKLGQVSRSFSAVILALPEELKESISLFYLVCRGLDTVEDDMAPAPAAKEVQLRAFHTHLKETDWNLHGFGDVEPEIELLENFNKVIEALKTIKPGYFDVIKDIADKMGNGMADFLNKKVETKEDYDLYCWYVAGLVGEGLSRLFAVSGLEDPVIAERKEVYKSMGLFLQKTNIIRDYLDDISQEPPRIWYPKEVWSKYTDKIESFRDPKNSLKAVACLNELVADALLHVEDCLAYLKIIKNPDVFRFCAIPQVMAIATLYECFNNPAVFTSEVKIRKSLAVRLILDTNDFSQVLDTFKEFTALFKAEGVSTPLVKSAISQVEKSLAKYRS